MVVWEDDDIKKIVEAYSKPIDKKELKKILDGLSEHERRKLMEDMELAGMI